jgi:hypothetical protein
VLEQREPVFQGLGFVDQVLYQIGINGRALQFNGFPYWFLKRGAVHPGDQKSRLIDLPSEATKQRAITQELAAHAQKHMHRT